MRSIVWAYTRPKGDLTVGKVLLWTWISDIGCKFNSNLYLYYNYRTTKKIEKYNNFFNQIHTDTQRNDDRRIMPKEKDWMIDT